MKTVLTLAAATALTLTAFEADAQSRRRRTPAQPAPVAAPAPAPYRLVGPGAAGAATPPGEAVRATPAEPATPAGEGQSATPATRAVPATPATPGAGTQQTGTEGAAGTETEAGGQAEAGPDTPERGRARTALTRVLGELASGTPDYAQMNEETATRVKAQQPSLTPALKQYGAVKTITPLAVAGGSQRFRVEFANGAATFVIATDAAGKITALGVE